MSETETKPNRKRWTRAETEQYIVEQRRNARTIAHEKPTKRAQTVRADLCENLEKWLLHFKPNNYPLPFSDDHRKVIKKLETAILTGGLFAEAMPRGSGKTTIATDAALFAILNGHRRFGFIVGADKASAVGILETIKTDLQFNDELHQCYPEVTTYFRALDGSNKKAPGQLQADGQPTRINMRAEDLVFPAVGDSECAESVIRVAGITGTIRGAKYSNKNGETIRPDFVIIDDPQTEESAESPSQCQKRLKIIRGDIMGLAGPGVKIACVIPCTVICEGDLSTQILDKAQMPEFQGERMAMVYKWPNNTDLWDDYCEKYKQELRDEIGHEQSTEFYKANQAAMDEGAQVAWPNRFVDGEEISALQHAYNLLMRVGDDAFWSEYQNEPKKKSNADYEITPQTVASRVNGLEKYQVRQEAAKVVSFVDMNYYGLHFAVVAIRGDFIGDVIDYGKYPAGRKKLVPDEDLTKSEIESYIWDGLIDLHQELEKRPYNRAGQPVKIDLSLVDIGSEHMAMLGRWCNQSRFSKLNILASRGYSNKKHKEQKNDILAGSGWFVRDWTSGKVKTRVLGHNADLWRVRMQRSFLKHAGAPGTLSFWGNDPKEHRAIADHVCGETLHEVVETAEGDLYQWRHKPGVIWDLGDCLTGCLAGAAACGIGARDVPRKKRKKPKRSRVQSSRI
jgi:hypothetical protein